ncbi:MAG: S8 family serine peptidase [Oscillospiraceae bacterium]|nr:S8 family serine peptidase [Oscillospiraceae bacterium]
MKKSKLLCILLAIVLIIGLSGSGFAITIGEATETTIGTDKDVPEEKIFSTATLDDDFADDRVMVVLTNAASLKLKTYKSSDFSEIRCASVNDLSTAAAARVEAKLNGKSVASVYNQNTDAVVFSDFYDANPDIFNQILCLTLPTKSKQGVLDSIKVLMQRDDVLYAGPDYVITAASTTPDDTYYSSQWALPKIKMPQAWDIEQGKSTVFVGVVDSGIHASHPDLSGKVDVGLSRECTGGVAMSINAVADTAGHGTQVAGVIAAQTDNNKGIAGIGWNVRLASLTVLGPDTDNLVIPGLIEEGMQGYSSSVLAAVNYADSARIPILNMSLGWEVNDPLYEDYPDYDANEYYDVALDQCLQNYAGLVVCAAGNDGYNLDTSRTHIYPAECNSANIICVGSSTQSDAKSSSSNYGATTVDLFAPGVGIYTTTKNGSYTSSASGTSLAAPHVAGVAALLLSECRTISVSRMKTIIMNGTDKISGLTSYCVSGGRLNAYNALQNAHGNMSYTQKNSTHHTVTCTCGTTWTEEHYFVAVGNRQECYDCGYRK